MKAVNSTNEKQLSRCWPVAAARIVIATGSAGGAAIPCSRKNKARAGIFAPVQRADDFDALA